MLDRFNHTANAILVSELTQQNLRYDIEADKWYFWSGDWKEEKYVDEFIRKAAVYREFHLSNIMDDRIRKEAKQWANNSFNMYHIRETRATMERMECFAFPVPNNSTMLFKTGNKVIDLVTLEVRDTRLTDGLTYGSNIEYDSSSQCPIWENLLLTAFHDMELIHYFQKMVGYFLTGETREQVFFHLVGIPGSGKSKIVSTLTKLLGEYAHSTDFRAFAKSKFDGSIINHELAPMRGKRLVATSEPSKNDKWDDKTLKTITGEDIITCRFLHKEEFQYSPQFKVIVMSNWKMYTEDLSGAFDRRYIPIPFDISFTEDITRTPDLNLDKKLNAELPGILNWALNGCQMWQKEGLRPIPNAILDVKADQKSENRSNVFGGVPQFAEECLQKSNLIRLSSANVYAAYTQWAESIRIPAHSILGSPEKVTQILRDLGFAPYRTNSARGIMAELTNTVNIKL